jgi:predicted transcriptional regulator
MVRINTLRRSTQSNPQAPPAIIQDADGAPTVRLGRREREVMAVLWKKGNASVQQVAQQLSTALAYTTVMTTLDRLFKKGLLRREKRYRAFVYSTALSAQEVEGQRATEFIRNFFDDSEQKQDVLLSCLIGAVQKYDSKLLDQLESELRSARARGISEDTSHKGDK